MNRKNISFITDKIYPYFVGGQEKRIYEYINILNESKEFNISIVSMKWWEGDDIKKENGITYIAICPKLEIYKKDGKRNIISSIRFGIATFFHVARTKNDILDIEIFPYFPIILAKLALIFKKQKPVIVGYWAEYWGKEYWKKYYNFFWFFGVLIEKMSFWACDRVVTNSNFTEERVKKAFGKNKKPITTIVPVSVDVDKIKKIQSQEKIYDIIYYGRIIEHKHVEHVIDVVKSLVGKNINVSALVIGNGPNEDIIKDMIEKDKLAKEVNLIDFVDSYDELIKHIKLAKIMIQPSEREGFGITVVEANACGLPVFLVDYPDNAAKELIKEGDNGFVCVDVDDLYNKASNLICDNEALHAISQSSKENAKKYSKNIMQEKVIKYYSKL